MSNIQVLADSEIRTTSGGTGITGRVGVLYQSISTGKLYRWDPSVGAMLDSGTQGPSISVGTSRTALASDNGGTLDLANGVTYTLSDAVPLPAGVTLLGPATGTATIAVTGTATINAATASIVMTAGQAYSAVPRPSNAAAFVVKGS
jgi:hypothetical protein